MNRSKESEKKADTIHKEPQQRVADLWMLAILILFFWPFLLIDRLLESVGRRFRRK